MKSSFGIALWAMLVLEIGIKETVAVGGLKWNKRFRIFEPIHGERSYQEEKKQRVLRSREQEIHNFNGEDLTIIYYEEPGFFEFYDNDTKARGICGEIWTMLSHSLNFTLVLKKIERKPTLNDQGKLTSGFRKILSDARKNQTDIVPKIIVSRRLINATQFTTALWTNRLRIFARPFWKGRRGWMFTIFSTEVWILVLIVILTLTWANIITQTVLTRNRIMELPDRSYLAHLFYTFASLCNQVLCLIHFVSEDPTYGLEYCNAPDNSGSGSRMLTLTVSVFCWLTLVSHGACLIQGITRETIDAPFNDLVTLFENTDLQILVVAGSISHNALTRSRTLAIYKRIVDAGRMSAEQTFDDAYRKVCFHPHKYVLYEEEDAVKTTRTTYCKLYPFDRASVPMYIASGITRRVKNRRSFDIGYLRRLERVVFISPKFEKFGILKLHESGMIKGIKSRYMVSKIEDFAFKQTRMQIIDLHRVTVTFEILGIGIVSSIVICVIENIVFAMKKREYFQRLSVLDARTRLGEILNILKFRG